MSAAYQEAEVSFVRDGGDPYGVASLAARLARNMGLIIAHQYLLSIKTDTMEKS